MPGAEFARERGPWRLAALAVAASFAVYVATAARAVQGGDNGEFCTLFAEGGVAHPSGYPLYVLVLRALSWLPAASPAHGAALATALVATASLAVLARAAVAWGASWTGAALAVAGYGLAEVPLRLATEAEVFALLALLAACVLLAAAPRAPFRGDARVRALALATGLALAHHHTALALAPLVGVGLWRARRRERARAASFAQGLGLFALGFAPYAYAAVAARWRGDRWVWGEPTSLRALAGLFAREDYWRVAAHASSQGAPVSVRVAGSLAAFAERFGADTLALPLLLALVAGVGLFGRAAGDEAATRAERSAPWLGALLAGPVLLALFAAGVGNTARGATGAGAAILERFYLLPELLVAVPIALGWTALLARTRRATDVGAALLVLVVAARAWSSPRAVARGRGETVERYATDVLATLPPRAVLVGTGDHRGYALLYAQRALGLRRDVLYVDGGMLALAWYRARVEHALGAGSAATVGELVASSLAAGRPTYVADPDVAAALGAPRLVPAGLASRVLAPDEETPTLDAQEEEQARLAARLSRGPLPADPWGWAGDLDEAYARPWIDLARAAARAGEPARAARCLRRSVAR